MESSSLKNNQLYDPIRKKWVENTPEETIRQLLLQQMVEELGYPKSLIAIEKELYRLPGLVLNQHSLDKIPKRRADIIVFAKSFQPMLMIECKAVPIVPKFAKQVIGYNTFVGAKYVAIANQEKVLTGFYDTEAGIYKFKPGLPRFQELTCAISMHNMS